MLFGIGQPGRNAMSINTLGIDLGKTVCHMVALDEGGQILFRRKLRRDQVLRMTANLPACRIGLERAAARTIWGIG